MVGLGSISQPSSSLSLSSSEGRKVVYIYICMYACMHACMWVMMDGGIGEQDSYVDHGVPI
jgi:hypothetical protein